MDDSPSLWNAVFGVVIGACTGAATFVTARLWGTQMEIVALRQSVDDMRLTIVEMQGDIRALRLSVMEKR